MSFKSKFINLPQSGFSHLVIPITVVVVIVILGGYTYERSSSAAAVYDNIHSGVTGKCLDDYYDRSVDGTKVDSYACNTGTSQEWTLRKEINNTYLVVNENGSCLDDYIAKTANGSPIAMYKCNPTDGAQLWFTTGNTLKNPRAGKCIEDTKGSTVNGTQLTLYPCNGDNDQKWTVEAAASTTPATLGIQNVGPTAISATSEKVTWTTTKAATGEFQYGKTTAYTVTDKNATASTTHNFTISGLAAGTVYDYKVTSTASGKTVTATGKFTTETASSGGTNGGGSVGTTAPPTTGTNATVDFRTTANGTQPLNTYSVGDTISTYGGNNANISNANWRGTLAALGPLAWRIPERISNGVATGAGGGGGGTNYVQYVDDMKGVAVIISAGATSDDDFSDTNTSALVHYYNDNGGQNGGPVKAWIVGNEPECGSGLGIGNYVGALPGVVNAMEDADPSIPITISAGAVCSQSNLGDLTQVANSSVGKDITYASWHGYQGKDGNGINSGQYAGPLYLSETQTASKDAGGKLSALEEFNWDSSCPGNGAMNTWQNENFIASVIGNELAGGGAHAYMYSDSNGCGTLSNGSNNDGDTEGTQLPAYWALGMWTGMNGEFDRFGSAMVDSKVDGIDVTDAAHKEVAGLAHEVELFATNNGKILAINENPTLAESMTIGIGGYASGTYTVWQTNEANSVGSAGAPKEVTANGSFTGSKITITLPKGSISSIDVK
jgi:hypothetical protein